MTPGGGRGWFHRKRSQPADPPTPDRSSVSNPPTDGNPITDAPISSDSPANETGAEPSSQSDAPLEPAVTLARSAAPPQQPGDPFQQRVEPVLSAGEVPAPSPGGPVDHEIRTSPGIDWDAETAAALSGDGEVMHHASGPNALDAHAAPDQLLEDLIREIVGDAAVDTASALHTPRPTMGAGEPPSQTSAHPASTDGSPSSGVENPGVQNPGVEVPGVQNPGMQNAGVQDPGVQNPGVQNPGVRNLGVQNGEDWKPELRTPDLPSPESTSADAPLGRAVPRQEDSHSTVTSASVDAYPPSAPTPLPNADEGAHEQSSPAASVPLSDQDQRSPSASPPPLAVAPPTPMPTSSESESRGAPTVALAATETTEAAGTTAESAPAPDVSRETSFDHGGTPLAHELADETRRRIALEEAVLPLPPETRVLTISNQKGGVGKTTTAVNLAAALARSGARVLVIDLDPQGNASTALGVDHRSDQKSVYEVLVADLALDEVVKTSTEHERLDCVPATIHLAGAEIELVSLVAREQRLRRALDAHLATMDNPYDYVFIDCPPSLGLLTINAFVAAREVLIPIQCEYYALEGLSQLLSNIELIEKHLNPDLRLSTILLTMYDSRTNLAQQVAQEVRDHFPAQTLSTIIPRSVRVSEAPSYGQSVISYDYASSGSLSYREAAAEIARRGAAEHQESN